MKLFTKKSLEELKKKMHIDNILEEMFGYESVPVKMANVFFGHVYCGICPFCDNFSFIAHVDYEKCMCFNCAFQGDIIDLLMGVKRWSFVETVEYLAKRFDVQLEESARMPLTKAKRRKRQQDYREAIRMMEEVEPGSVDKELIERVEKMSDETTKV